MRMLLLFWGMPVSMLVYAHLHMCAHTLRDREGESWKRKIPSCSFLIFHYLDKGLNFNSWKLNVAVVFVFTP